VLDYAVALSQTPADASDELVESLRRSLSDEQLFSEGAFCPLPE
jgi:hypothetical protein